MVQLFSLFFFFFPLKLFTVGSYPHYPELTLYHETSFFIFPANSEYILKKKKKKGTSIFHDETDFHW